MSDLNSDLNVQDVDDALREDNLKKFWLAYRPYIVGLAVSIVLLVGGREAYTAYVVSNEEASSTAFEEAETSAAADTANAAQIWQQAASDVEGGYKALAQLRLAASAAANGDTAGAVAAYDAVAADSGTDQSLRSLARLFAGMLIARDAVDLDDARSRLSVVAIQGDPWYFSALEQLALVDIKRGDREAAIQGFTQLTDDVQTPQSIRQRATQLKSALEAELGIDPLADAPTASSVEETP